MSTNTPNLAPLPEYVHGHRTAVLGGKDEDGDYLEGADLLAAGADLKHAQVVTSWTGDREAPPVTTATDWSALAALPETFHRPVLDLDFPAHVVPSTTPGHGHLYLDKVLTWSDYVKVLEVLGEVGILEPGYVSASIAREFTAVRLPWVKKPAAEPRHDCHECSYPEPHGHGFACNSDCATCKEWLAKEAAAPTIEQEN